MSTPARREARHRLPDILDWLESPFTSMFPFAAAQTLRVEEFIDDDRYVVRAELPDVDPDKDVEITVDDGMLTIRAERREERKDVHRSEFRYGSFTRSLRLPAGVNADDVTARYDKGILEITIPMPERKPAGRRIAVNRSD